MMDGPTLNQLHLQINNSQNGILSVNSNNEVEWWLAFSFAGRLIAYVIILVLMVAIITFILKYMDECDFNRTTENLESRETNPLLPEKPAAITYGTCQDDLESGNSSNDSSSEDLYDGKICVICYDEQRNCFFVPCGHCATCYVCAQRILDGESRTCPVCRRLIGKVRKLFVL